MNLGLKGRTAIVCAASQGLDDQQFAARHLRYRPLESGPRGACENSSREVGAVTEEIRITNPSKRFGHPDEFGATCAFLCSSQAGYITGQNILIDGGAYPGTF